MEAQLESVEIPGARYLSAEDIASVGGLLDGYTVHHIAQQAWRDIASGLSYGIKSVLPISSDGGAHCQSFTNAVSPDERLGWKLSCLSAVNSRYGSVKIVGANARNRQFGLPRSRSVILLFDKFTMSLLCVMDGTAISAARTASYVTIVREHFFNEQKDLSIFLIGAGPVAERVVLALESCCFDSVKRLFVRSRTRQTAIEFANAKAGKVSYDIIPVHDNQQMRNCDYVITASNASAPVFDATDVGEALVLHLGGDETPVAHIKRGLKCGTLICDNLEMVARRGSQSLALYFSRQDTSLEKLAPLLDIHSLPDVINNPNFRLHSPIHITCVGLPMLDLYVAAHVYETLCPTETC